MKVTIDEIVEALHYHPTRSTYRVNMVERIRTHGIAPPKGYAIVPIVPTDEMLKAADVAGNEGRSIWGYASPYPVYKAMLTAAPKQENSNE